MSKQSSQPSSMRKGIALMMCLIFMAIFSALTVGLMTTSSTNAQVADNHRKTNTAMNSALSGLECAKSIIAHTPTFSTNRNTVSATDASQMWSNLCTTLRNTALGGLAVGSATTFTDGIGTGTQIVTPAINFGSAGQSFTIRFYRYDANPTRILLDCNGNEGTITRKVHLEMDIRKQAEVLNYAIASRGRMWVTQNSIIHGPIYSSWNRPSLGTGIETTADTTIEGSISTAITLADLRNYDLQMETLDAERPAHVRRPGQPDCRSPGQDPGRPPGDLLRRTECLDARHERFRLQYQLVQESVHNHRRFGYGPDRVFSPCRRGIHPADVQLQQAI